MTVEQRVATTFREVEATEPGLVVDDAGSTLVVLPDGSRHALPFAGATSIPGPLPTPGAGTAGQVLALDDGLEPVWQTAAWASPPVNLVAPQVGVVSQVAGGTPGAGDWIGLVDLGTWTCPDPDGNATTFAFQWQDSTDGGDTWVNVASHGSDPSIQVTTATLYRLVLTATNATGTGGATSNVVSIA